MRTLIKHGLIVDPASHVHSQNNLLVEDGRIQGLTAEEPEADVILDAEGMVVSPGFVDIHMHEDPYDPEEGRLIPSIMTSMLRMGVTTAIGGNCGINTVSPLRYLELMDRDGGPINMGLLAGHTFLREQAGHRDKYSAIRPDEQQRLSRLAKEALEAGCFGVSFGIRYVPGVTRDEMVKTACFCQSHGRLVAAHVRDDADNVFGAVEELVSIGRQLDLPVQVSHVGSMGGFGQMERLLALIDRYRASGMELSGDCYPYDAFSTRIGETTYDEAEDVALALSHPAIMLASDGLMDRGQGHPRGAGAFPRLLCRYVAAGKMNLDDAVAKMSAMPAQKLGLTRKGTLRKGADADIVIFDMDRIRDCATFEHPDRPPEGIEWVLIGGKIAVEHGTVKQSSLGRAIRA